MSTSKPKYSLKDLIEVKKAAKLRQMLRDRELQACESNLDLFTYPWTLNTCSIQTVSSQDENNHIIPKSEAQEGQQPPHKWYNDASSSTPSAPFLTLHLYYPTILLSPGALFEEPNLPSIKTEEADITMADGKPSTSANSSTCAPLCQHTQADYTYHSISDF